MNRPSHSSGTCPTCGAESDRLEMAYDEDSGEGLAILKVQQCSQLACGKLLCTACDFFECDGCQRIFCADHLVSVEDGTDTPLHCCPACAEEGEEFIKPMPPVREIRPIPATVEVA